MATGVVRDHSMARALQRTRTHDDVATGRGEAVQQHDGSPFPDSSPAELDAGALDHDLSHAGRYIYRIARGYARLTAGDQART